MQEMICGGQSAMDSANKILKYLKRERDEEDLLAP